VWGHHNINNLAVFDFALVFFSETLSETKRRRTTLFSGIDDLFLASELSTRAGARANVFWWVIRLLGLMAKGEAFVGRARADTPAARRLTLDVCHPAASACPAPHNNTTVRHTDKSTEVCV